MAASQSAPPHRPPPKPSPRAGRKFGDESRANGAGVRAHRNRDPDHEPVIGHTKAEHRMGRNHLAGTRGDAANAILAAAGYNFRRLLEWRALLLSFVLAALRLPDR